MNRMDLEATESAFALAAKSAWRIKRLERLLCRALEAIGAPSTPDEVDLVVDIEVALGAPSSPPTPTERSC